MRHIKKIAIGILAGILTSCGASSPAMAEVVVADLPDQVVYLSDEESETCVTGSYLAYRYWVEEGSKREDGCWNLNEHGSAVIVQWPDRTITVLRYGQLQRTEREE